MSKKEDNDSMTGKPWSIHSTHNSYESALLRKEELDSGSVQVKIRRRSDGTFDIKMRNINKKTNPLDMISEGLVEEKITKRKKPKPKTRAGRRAEKMRRQAMQKT